MTNGCSRCSTYNFSICLPAEHRCPLKLFSAGTRAASSRSSMKMTSLWVTSGPTHSTLPPFLMDSFLNASWREYHFLWVRCDFFPSYVFKQLSSHLLSNLNMLVSWAKNRKSVQKAKTWALLLSALTWKGFIPNASNPVLFLLQESHPLGQKPTSPRNTTTSSWRQHGQILPPNDAKSVSSECQVQLDHVAWSPRPHCCSVYRFRVSGNDDYGADSDKIVFQGVSSVVEAAWSVPVGRRGLTLMPPKLWLCMWSCYARATLQVGDTGILGGIIVFQDLRADSGEKIMKTQATKSPIPFQRTSFKPTVSTIGPKKEREVSGSSVSHLVQPSFLTFPHLQQVASWPATRWA